MAQKNSFDPFYISSLVVKMINSELTVAEQADLNEWLAADPDNHFVIEKLLDKNLWNKEINNMNAFDSEAALQQVLEKIHPEHAGKTSRTKIWPNLSKLVAAAVLLVAIGSVFYFLKGTSVKEQVIQAKANKRTEDHGDKVMLTLADGTKVDIASVGKGSSIRQGAAVVTDLNGTLNYEVDENAASATQASVSYNTLTVPLGKQYQLTLPDGSEVWLNANSSLRYPVAFDDGDRIVELIGEGYFEIKHIADQPFKVKSNDQVVEVLGTQFNIEAYPEDSKTTTTLAEGSVRINKGKMSVRLQPGQMAVNSQQKAQLHVAAANVTEALAWKDGLFSFSDDRIEDIMRKVSRSYDVEVEFKGDVKDKRFWGVFPKNKGLANLLKNLEQTKTVHFKIVGRRVLVMP